MSSKSVSSLPSLDLEQLDLGDDDDGVHVLQEIISESASLKSSTKEADEAWSQQCLAHQETKAISWIRIAMLTLLFGTALALSSIAYVYLARNEHQHFETSFASQAARVKEAFSIKSKTKIHGTLQTFAASITSQSRFHSDVCNWPYVTVPDFERIGSAAANLADAMSITLVPIVSESEREAWEQYSQMNQGWLVQGLEIQKEQAEEEEEIDRGKRRQRQRNRERRRIQEGHTSEELRINNNIHGLDDGLRVIPDSTAAGPYLPQWQTAPAVPIPSLVNLNLVSHGAFRNSAIAVLQAESIIVGRSFDFSNLSNGGDEDVENKDVDIIRQREEIFKPFVDHWDAKNNNKMDYGNDPVVDIYIPIFNTYDAGSREIVGFLVATIYWRIYLEDMLAEHSAVDVVLKNTCGQQYTYHVEGPNVYYAGPDDLHDRRYDQMVDRVVNETASDMIGMFLPYDDAADVDGNCFYSIDVYPNKTFEAVYVTRKPIWYTIIMVSIFLFTSALFVFYDCLIERRQRVVMDKATTSSAIVSSLFPKNVRDRLFKDELQHNQEEKSDSLLDSKEFQFSAREDIELKILYGSCKEHPGAAPIADLFENCTVLFADIVGFTSWSSGRQPSDVFYLLETLYDAIDEIADKNGVFKVETIGDCYLAVAGLPEPQENHAIIMALFTKECLYTVKKLLSQELQASLGGSTKNLSMRFGLHSGPVTAGVLRGERSRFQLFGDTVNTAARMESTGRRDHTHVSQTTADYLIKADKGHWLQERDDKVMAKGKGLMQTYWLKIRPYNATRDGTLHKSISKDAAFRINNRLTNGESKYDRRDDLRNNGESTTAKTEEEIESSGSFENDSNTRPSSPTRYSMEDITYDQEAPVLIDTQNFSGDEGTITA